MDSSELIEKKGSKEINGICFFCHTTSITDSEEDEKADLKNYSEYKKRHPKDGNAVWINKRTNKEYFYANGEEKIIHINSDMDESLLEEIKSILQFLNSNKEAEIHIKEGYDYVWIRKVIADNLFNGCSRLTFKSMPDYRNFILKLGFNNICGSETLNKYYNSINGQYPYYVYSDNKGNTVNEKKRRNGIIVDFVEKMREIRGNT